MEAFAEKVLWGCDVFSENLLPCPFFDSHSVLIMLCFLCAFRFVSHGYVCPERASTLESGLLPQGLNYVLESFLDRVENLRC